MKKGSLSLVFVLVLTASLTACSSTEQAASAPAEETVTAAEENSEEISEETVEEVTPEEAPEEAVPDEAAIEAEANECYETGRAFLYGLDGKEIDLEAAHTNFEKALELGKTEANYYLGLLCDTYCYPTQDFAQAKAYYEACGDNPYAKVALGLMYYDGDGVDEDKEKANELFQEVIAQGYPEGYYGTATSAYVDQDYSKAFEEFNKVLEGTEQFYTADASRIIGFLYKEGTGAEQDYSKAIEWFEKAIALGNPSSITELALMYAHGTGVEEDFAKALELYEKAADLRDRKAMNNIAYMYVKGSGVEQDYSKALEWFEKAADLGNDGAMKNIAYLYENGEGVEQDLEKALEWYKKAADLGNEAAMEKVTELEN